MRVAFVHGVGTADGTDAAGPVHDLRIGCSVGFIVEAKIGGGSSRVRSGELLLWQTWVALLLQTALLF